MDSSAPLSDLKGVTCPNCGASLSYKPGTTKQVCEYCGSSFEIQPDGTTALDAQKENDLATAMAGSWEAAQSEGQAYVVKCPACGAETAMEKNMFSDACAFCGSPLTVKPDTKAIANPQAVLPFKLEKKVAAAVFDTWVHRLWFAPNNLKKIASSDRFNGVYLPFWTFDANTESAYEGQRGDHYTETVRRTVNGREETQQVIRTRWSGVRGRVQRAFNDILITASRALPEQYLNALEPWDLANLAPYDNRYLSGFRAEVSQVNIKAGFEAAKGVMATAIQQDVRYNIGGDEQRITALQTNYSNRNYKYILLPVWLSVYRYGNKIYRFVVNARTGEVHGERPYSAIKIALAVLAGLIILTILIYIFGNN
jgi:DNA-directed RNA polymerase subunit M/transcription elongation factor TFIIS